MHAHITVQLHSVHSDHSHYGLFGRVSHNVGTALDWLTGPAMTEQERSQLTLADVRNRRFEDTAL